MINAVLELHAAEDFQGRAVVFADGDRPQMDFAITADDRDLRAFLAKEHRVDRNRDFLRVDAGPEVHFAKRARQQASVPVGHIHFRQQGACHGIDCLRRAHDRALEFLAGQLRQGDPGFHSGLNGGRVILRDADVHAQRIDAGHVKQFFARGPADGAGVDQRAGIDVALGQHAGERRINVLEGFQLFQAPNVGVGRVEVGLGLLVSTGLLIGFLLRNRVGLAQADIAVGIDLGQVHLRHDLLPVGAGLHQLLVHLRGVDVGQQFALGDAAADVFVPAQQIAVGASVNRRLFVGLQRSRQHQFLVGLFRRGMDDGNRGNGFALGLVGQHVAVVHAHEHRDHAANDQQQQHKANQQQRLARWRRGKLRRRRYLRRLAFVVQDFGRI